MMDLKMEVYSPYLELLGLLEIQNSIIWERKAFSAGSFSLSSLITEETLSLLVPENIIWIAGEDAGIIEYVQEEAGENGPYISVKGCDLTGILARRILWGRYDLSGPVPELMYRLVDDCCINPTRGNPPESRVIPGLVLAGTAPTGGQSIRSQKTGGELLEALEELGETYQVPFGVRFNPKVPQMEFWARYGVNRSVNQNVVEPVFYSTELDDVLSSEYSYNAQNYRNVALVAGEGEGNDRVMITVNGNAEPAPVPPTPPTPTYIINLSVDPEGGGLANGGGVVSEGQSVTVTATPSDGYNFTGWQENGGIVSESAEYTFTVTGDRELVAVFAVKSGLPEGYTKIEYILTDVNCGIDTGVKVNANSNRLVMDIEYKNGAEDNFIFATYGANISGLGWRYFSLFVNTATLFGYRDNSSNFGTIKALTNGQRGIIDFDFPSKKLSVGNEEKTINAGNYSLTNNTYLGKAGSGDKTATYKLFSAEIYNNGDKIRSFIPCINPSNVVGLYDLVEGKFYQNAWSGTLTPGPAV